MCELQNLLGAQGHDARGPRQTVLPRAGKPPRQRRSHTTLDHWLHNVSRHANNNVVVRNNDKQATRLPSNPAAKQRLAAKQPGCQATRLPSNPAAKQPGCQATAAKQLGGSPRPACPRHSTQAARTSPRTSKGQPPTGGTPSSRTGGPGGRGGSRKTPRAAERPREGTPEAEDDERNGNASRSAPRSAVRGQRSAVRGSQKTKKNTQQTKTPEVLYMECHMAQPVATGYNR